jgi:hypothetical protein
MLRKARITVLASACAIVALSTGCNEETLREFRAAATDTLQQGVSTILDGVVEGVFAVVAPEEEETTTP